MVAGMSDGQKRRLGFGIIATLLGVAVLFPSLSSIEQSAYGAMLLPTVIGVLLVGVGVYLLVRFFILRGRAK